MIPGLYYWEVVSHGATIIVALSFLYCHMRGQVIPVTLGLVPIPVGPVAVVPLPIPVEPV